MLPEVTVEDVKAMRDRGDAVTVLDVREPWELEIAHLDDVLAIPMGQVPDHLETLPRDHPLMVLCRSGMRSAKVVAWLSAQGFDNAANIEGGILAWSARLDPSVPQY